jgi:hypothetical protein
MLGLVIVTVVVIAWPQRLRGTGVVATYAIEPVLRPCLAACLLTAVVGLVVNDSGIIVLAIAFAVALPFVADVWVARE